MRLNPWPWHSQLTKFCCICSTHCEGEAVLQLCSNTCTALLYCMCVFQMFYPNIVQTINKKKILQSATSTMPWLNCNVRTTTCKQCHQHLERECLRGWLLPPLTTGDMTDSLSRTDHSSMPTGKNTLHYTGDLRLLWNRQQLRQPSRKKNTKPNCVSQQHMATHSNACHEASPQSAGKAQTHLSSFTVLFPLRSLYSSLWQHAACHALHGHGVAWLNGSGMNERVFSPHNHVSLSDWERE